jgi:hypothetical protein
LIDADAGVALRGRQRQVGVVLDTKPDWASSRGWCGGIPARGDAGVAKLDG